MIIYLKSGNMQTSATDIKLSVKPLYRMEHNGDNERRRT